MSYLRPAQLAVAVATAALLACAPAAGAQTITVASLADSVDATPANGTCEAPCTLRAAIQTANGALSPGADTIVLPAGTYDRTTAGADGADPAATGDLDITGDLTITGAGQALTTVDAKGLDRGFDIAGATVSISGLTITGGLATDGAFTTAGGGARVGFTPQIPGPGLSGSLTLTDVTLRANSAQDGAGVATDNATAALSLTRVSVLDNVAGAGSTEGGGVNERFGGSVTIASSLIRGNSAAAGGGVVDDGGGTIAISDTTITQNHASPTTGQAGGVYETGGGTVTITRSIVSANTSAEGAGVVEDGGGKVTIVDSTIVSNADNPASSFHDGGGILQDANGTLTISGSAIVANTAVSGAGLQSIGRGTIAITNTTFSANHATQRGGAIQGYGAGTMTLTNTTLRDDVADAGASEIDNCDGPPSCGTIRHAFTLRNTIVSGGSTACSGTITSAGHNIDAGSSCGFAAAGDLAGTNALLGPLADNGGPTQTAAELDGSPTIDAGDPAGCPAADQRGVARPLGAGCDIGAFERAAAAPVAQPPAPVPAPVVVSKAAPQPKASDLIVLPSSRRCVSRRLFRIRLRKLTGVTIVSARVLVNGKPARVVKGKRLQAPVDLRGLPKGRFTVKITITTAAGKALSSSRRYRTCTPKHAPRKRAPKR